MYSLILMAAMTGGPEVPTFPHPIARMVGAVRGGCSGGLQSVGAVRGGCSGQTAVRGGCSGAQAASLTLRPPQAPPVRAMAIVPIVTAVPVTTIRASNCPS